MVTGSMKLTSNMSYFSSEEIRASFVGTYCCRNDSQLSLEDYGTDLSALLGYTPQEITDIFRESLLELILPEDRQTVLEKISQQLAAGDQVELACRFRHKDGRNIWALNKCRRTSSESGDVFLCGILTDITQSKGVHDDLHQKLDQLNIILAQTENIIFEWDLLADTIFFSDTWERIFGYAPITQNFGKAVSAALSHLHPDDVPLLFHHLNLLKNGISYQAIDGRIAHADGHFLWCRFRATAIFDDSGNICKLVGIIINIDEEKREATALRTQAEHDSLTKLLNKQAAQEKVIQYLQDSAGGVGCVLMIIDLDDFKHVNDQHGHMVGDFVLSQCATEIRNLFRPLDIVARIGGDEFMVLMKDISDEKIVEQRCIQLATALRTMQQPYLPEQTISCSIGASFAPQHGTSYYDLFIAADQALYHAKNLGKNQFAFYEKQITESASQTCASSVSKQISSDTY